MGWRPWELVARLGQDWRGGDRKDQCLDQDQLAARIAAARVQNQADIRATMRRAAQFIDVQMAREKTRLTNLNRPDSRRFTWESADQEGT